MNNIISFIGEDKCNSYEEMKQLLNSLKKKGFVSNDTSVNGTLPKPYPILTCSG